jgi:hypothetical protein
MQVSQVGTPAEFWSVVDAIPKEAFENGMFFFMKKGVRPTWDSPENERGGAWSKKIDASYTHETFIDMMVHCVLGKLLQTHKETLQGITLSPKGSFHILKIWNSASNLNDRKFITHFLGLALYSPFSAWAREVQSAEVLFKIAAASLMASMTFLFLSFGLLFLPLSSAVLVRVHVPFAMGMPLT